MENNIYSSEIRASSPYIIVVKQFTGPNYCVPPAGTKAYSYPKSGSSEVCTFSQPTADIKYVINQLVYCDGKYWVKIPNLGINFADGYVKCDDIGYNYTNYANPDNQTPNSVIGTNNEVIFNMWYLPTDVYKGVNCATPLYYQYYYVSGKRENSLKCTLFASISGLYGVQGLTENPTSYMDRMTEDYWSDLNGIKVWLAAMARTTDKNTIKQKAKANLDAHKPLIVGAQNKSGTNHMVLVAGYKNSGNSLSDYLVLDSCEKKFTTLAVFFQNYPDFPGSNYPYIDWAIGGTGYVYGEY